LTPKLIKVFTSGSVLVLLSLFLYKDANLTLRRIHENKETARIDLFLRNCGCTSAKELFTDDFYIYFRTMPPYRPYCNGGALRWGTNLNNEDYPEFPVASLEEFSAECKNKRVRFVLLTDHCDRLSPSLGKIYNGTSFEGIILKLK
jgi:hypothetical protein